METKKISVARLGIIGDALTKILDELEVTPYEWLAVAAFISRTGPARSLNVAEVNIVRGDAKGGCNGD